MDINKLNFKPDVIKYSTAFLIWVNTIILSILFIYGLYFIPEIPTLWSITWALFGTLICFFSGVFSVLSFHCSLFFVPRYFIDSQLKVGGIPLGDIGVWSFIFWISSTVVGTMVLWSTTELIHNMNQDGWALVPTFGIFVISFFSLSIGADIKDKQQKLYNNHCGNRNDSLANDIDHYSRLGKSSVNACVHGSLANQFGYRYGGRYGDELSDQHKLLAMHTVWRFIQAATDSRVEDKEAGTLIRKLRLVETGGADINPLTNNLDTLIQWASFNSTLKQLDDMTVEFKAIVSDRLTKVLPKGTKM